MARVHETVCQAGEMTFCDCTSSLDRFNTALSVLSTAHCASGMPLGVILSSDEREETLAKGLDMLKSILPEKAFFGRGSSTGPMVIMTDDSTTERAALRQAWPSTTLLLCTFHFLQRRWTWLWEGKNRVRKEHRNLLINQVKDMVYAQSDTTLHELFSSFQSNDVVQTYPNFITHMKSLMEKAKEWAHCHRKCLMIRGNHTNNYAEAGIKILKELVFSRIKAYNMVQMFHFVVDTMDNYYKRKLLSIANNRLETYVALRFKGVNTKKIVKEDIQKGMDNWYSVRSQSEQSTWYDVNPAIGICTCIQGRDGSPCSHQAAIVYQLGEESMNYICTLSAQARLQIAKIAVGDKAITNVSFYASLHQRALEEKYIQDKKDISISASQPDFTGTEWDLIRSGAQDDSTTSDVPIETYTDYEHMSKMIESMAEDMKKSLLHNDPQLSSGIDKFISRYFNLSSRKSYALLASALHSFGKQSTGVVHDVNHLRHGPRIPIQATAAGRRKKGVSRGKGKIPAGRPVKAQTPGSKSKAVITRYFLPTRYRELLDDRQR